MNVSTLWLLLLLMTSLMTALTWIGLRFFRPSTGSGYAGDGPRPREGSRVPPDPSAAQVRRMAWPLAALLLAALVVSLVLVFSEHILPPAMTGEDLGPTGEVAAILGEEVRVPPQPLPPSVFTGTGCFDLEHADRDWNNLDTGFRNTVLELFSRMESRGYPMALLEGFRGAERQEVLARKGPGVTRARGGQSLHQFGLAADMSPLRDGRLVISERDPWASAAYRALGEEAEALGLAWGGKWAMRDLGHVEQAVRVGGLSRPPAS